MKDLRINRNSFRDVFHSELVRNADFTDDFIEMPILTGCHEIPASLSLFSKSLNKKDPSSWIHFYEDDYKFERIWNNPHKYLPLFKRFAGVISPDFSVYIDMPLPQQIWNICRSKAFGSWLESKEIKVIPNIRFGDSRTFELACSGIPEGSVVSIGSLGCVRNPNQREIFKSGINYMISRIKPQVVIVYGRVPDDIFGEFKE